MVPVRNILPTLDGRKLNPFYQIFYPWWREIVFSLTLIIGIRYLPGICNSRMILSNLRLMRKIKFFILDIQLLWKDKSYSEKLARDIGSEIKFFPEGILNL